jgi:hypothetical protein
MDSTKARDRSRVVTITPGTWGDWPVWGPALPPLRDRREAIRIAMRIARAMAREYGGIPVYRIGEAVVVCG